MNVLKFFHYRSYWKNNYQISGGRIIELIKKIVDTASELFAGYLNMFLDWINFTTGTIFVAFSVMLILVFMIKFIKGRI